MAVKLRYVNGHLPVEPPSSLKLDSSSPCRLNVFFSKGGILLKDGGLRCAPLYCGTHGKLDNVSRPKLDLHRR